MSRIELPTGDGDEIQRVWELRPELGAAAAEFNRAAEETSIISPQESEAARIRIGHINGCEPCSQARSSEMDALGLDESFYEDVDDPSKRGRYTTRELLAIEFAERFAAGKSAFDDAFWERLRASYDDAEIVDLAGSCAKWLGLGRINAVLDLHASCALRLEPSKTARRLAAV
jgi:alkylhydroperoxidase family enzyme